MIVVNSGQSNHMTPTQEQQMMLDKSGSQWWIVVVIHIGYMYPTICDSSLILVND